MNRFRNSIIHFCICVVIALALSFTACRREVAKPLCLVFIIDLTRSIEAESQRQAFDAIQASLKELKRGDSIAVIPITGDAMTQAQGRIIRFRLADKREAYDEDLSRFAQEVNERLQRLREEAVNNPYNRSDVLGAVGLASEELANARPEARRMVIQLSDQLQDDSQYNFKRDARLLNAEAAARFAEFLALGQKQTFADTEVFLGLLRSVDIKSLSPARRAALPTFWQTFFTRQGATSVRWATDGSGELANFVKQSQDLGVQRRVE